ncbi:hypothetical protein AYO38_09495 [bacterium SCGC AG-212-C10]|nr:hypothetical protein AYO38_09495 [bacterium SCGC AG-212-C10]
MVVALVARRPKLSNIRDLAIIVAMLLVAGRLALPFVPAFAQEGNAAATDPAAVPLASTFTYQGRLNASGADASGAYDFQFLLFDAAIGGVQVGSTITAAGLAVTDGLFVANLNFGEGAFAGDSRWLEVRVKAPAAVTYEPLGRQELTATPYALYARAAAAAQTASTALSVPWSGVTGVPADIADGDQLGPAYTAQGPVSLVANAFGFSTVGCTAGEVWKYSGAGDAWSCEPDAGGVSYTAGAGLTLAANQFSVNFASAGTIAGTATTVARSDHSHFGQTWVGTDNSAAALQVVNSGAGSGLDGESNGGTGVFGSSDTASGLYGVSNSSSGVYGQSNTSTAGVFSGKNGIQVFSGLLGYGVKAQGYGRGLPLAVVSGSNIGASCGSNALASLTDTCIGVAGFAIETQSSVGVLGLGALGVVGVQSVGGSYAGYFAGKVEVTSELVTTNVRPVTTDAYDLGSASRRWNNIYVKNPPITASDVRLKTGITPLPYGLDAVLALHPVAFGWKEDADGTHLGLLAQDVAAVIPEIVKGDASDADAPLGLAYSELIPVLIRAIQDQQGEIESLRAASAADSLAGSAALAWVAITAALAALALAGGAAIRARRR